MIKVQDQHTLRFSEHKEEDSSVPTFLIVFVLQRALLDSYFDDFSQPITISMLEQGE